MKLLSTQATTLPAIVVTTVLVTMQSAFAVLVINDTFTRTGPLVGSMADTGQTWTGSGAFSTNGSQLIVNSNNAPRIGGLTFQPNQTYELSLDLTVSTGGTGWIAFGYTDASQSSAFHANRGAMLHRQTPEIQTFNSGGTGAQTIGVANSFPKSLAIVLDTGTTLANSTLSFLVNGSTLSTRPADVNSIDGVFIQANGATGIVDNFSFAAVPEPSSFAFFTLLFVGIVGGKRFSRARAA